MLAPFLHFHSITRMACTECVKCPWLRLLDCFLHANTAPYFPHHVSQPERASHTCALNYLVQRRGIGNTPRDFRGWRGSTAKKWWETQQGMCHTWGNTEGPFKCFIEGNSKVARSSFAEVNIEVCRMSSHIFIVFLQQHSALAKHPNYSASPSSLPLLW